MLPYMRTIDEKIIQELRSELRGPVLVPTDPGYDEARTIFNGMFDRRPALIVRATGAADIMDVVRFVRRHELDFSVRGGGHNVAGKAVCDGGLMLDLSLMKGVRVDRERATVRVQGGATWGDVDRETQAFGLATTGGIVTTTGVAGLTLNGGIGWLRNKYGTSSDNLVSADVVTADAELLTASERENPELFWALRGGGGNFGVVTSFEFRLHPVGPCVAAAFTIYPIESAAEVTKRWREWVSSTPDEVTSELVFWTMPPAPQFPTAAHGRQVVVVATVYAGEAGEGTRVLETQKHFGEPFGEIAGEMPYRVVQAAFDPFFPATGELLSYWKSLYADAFGDNLIDAVLERASNRSSSDSMVTVQHLGGALGRVPVEATAFATRTSPYLISFFGTWRDPSENDRHIAWVRDGWDRLAPLSTRAVYLNFLADDERDRGALVRAAFGPNYDRLVEIKTKYDPNNLFRLNQNIEPCHD